MHSRARHVAPRGAAVNGDGFSLARVLELVAAVDAAMPVGPPIEVAVGGAVAMMRIAPGRLSEDIDVYEASLHPDLTAAVAVVAGREGLDPGWLNNAAAQFGLPAFDLQPEPLYEGRRLVLKVMEPVTMLLLKLNAGRDKDMHDIVLLMAETGFTTEDDLLMLIDSYFEDHPESDLDRAWMEDTAMASAALFRAQHWGTGIDPPEDPPIQTPKGPALG